MKFKLGASSGLLTHALFVALHYLRAPFVGDSERGWAARSSRTLSMAKESTVDEGFNVMDDFRDRHLEIRRSDRARSLGRLKEELEYLRLFFIQPVCNFARIIKLTLKVIIMRRKVRKLFIKIQDSDVLIDKLLANSGKLLLENAQLENKAINMRLLSSSEGKLGSEGLDGSKGDHFTSSISSTNEKPQAEGDCSPVTCSRIFDPRKKEIAETAK